MKLTFMLSATLASCALFITACSSSSSSSNDGADFNDPESVTGELVIASGRNDAEHIAALETAGAAFSAEYTNVSVRYTHTATAVYNENLINTLTVNTPDIVSWYAGNRLNALITENLLDDISDIWTHNNLGSSMSAAASAVTRDDQQWGIPISNYGWGIYYRRDIFESLNLTEPVTWDEFQSVAETLKANNVTPLSIGTQFLWTTASVFDYLNLRINGFHVHDALTVGQIKFTDERIRSVFAIWKELVDQDYFVDAHETMNWQESLVPMIDGDAAMVIMGNFAINSYQNAGGSLDDLGFFAFPEVSPNIPRAEEAPTDIFALTKNANNKPAARAFLSFISRADVQSEWNKTLNQLPVNQNAEIADDRFLRETAEVVHTATALSQFFDRDAPAAMAQAALEGFQEFMLDTTKLDAILLRLDEVQNTVYGNASSN